MQTYAPKYLAYVALAHKRESRVIRIKLLYNAECVTNILKPKMHLKHTKKKLIVIALLSTD